MKKGFSIIALIILILVLGGLGFGGYYAYNNYIAPALNPNAAFIPDNLKAYAKGSDADVFLIFNDENRNIKTLLNLVNVPDEYDFSMESGIIISKNSTQCAGAALEFESNEKAANVKALIQNALENNSDPSVTFKIEQKDTILLIDVNEGFNGLTGSLTDNPLFKNLDPEYLENELVIAINNKNIPDIASGLLGPLNTVYYSGANLSSFIPTANAQLIAPNDSPALIRSAQPSEPAPGASSIINPESTMLLYTVENTIIYAGINKLEINLALQMKLMDKATLEESEMFKIIPGADADNFYKKADEVFNKDLNEEFKKAKEKLSSFEGSSEYKDLKITIKIKFDIKQLIAMMFSSLPTVLNSEARGRDAARKGNINIYVASLEAYNSDNGKYPAKSVCTNEIFGDDADLYFSDGVSPSDPSGAQTFGSTTCENGYYYQSYNNGAGYILWSKMENETNGNINTTPDDPNIFEIVAERKYENKGQYFIYSGGMIVSKPETKVKRKPITSTTEADEI